MGIAVAVLAVAGALPQTSVASEASLKGSAAVLNVTYSNAARQKLADTSEGVIASLAYFVAPSEAGKARANESGTIALGYESAQATPDASAITLRFDGLERIDTALTARPVMVNVNVGSARLSSDDNVLACDFFEGELQVLQSGEVTLDCWLIAEEAQTRMVTTAAADQALIGPQWHVEEIAGRKALDDAAVVLEFMDDGRLSGNASCNSIRGQYALSGDQLTIDPLGTTRMLCEDATMEQEQRLLELLAAVTGWSINSDGALLLKTAEGAEIVARKR